MTSKSITGRRDFTDNEMLDAKDNVQFFFQKKSQCRRAASSKIEQNLERKADCLYDLRILSGHRSL